MAEVISKAIPLHIRHCYKVVTLNVAEVQLGESNSFCFAFFQTRPVQDVGVGPAQHLTKHPNNPIFLFFFFLKVKLVLYFPKSPVAIKAPSSAQESFAHRRRQ